MEENALIQDIRNKIASDIVGYHNYKGDETFLIRRESAYNVLKLLKDEFQFEMLMDLSAADYPGRQPRFEVVYHLNSLSRTARLRIKVPVDEGEEIDSVCAICPIANWLERECWDMFGIKFKNHPDLRRLLMYDEFVGHPLRKDYPINKRQPLVKPKHEYR